MIAPGITVTVRVNDYVGRGDCLGQAMEMLHAGIVESGDGAMIWCPLAGCLCFVRLGADMAAHLRERHGWA